MRDSDLICVSEDGTKLITLSKITPPLPSLEVNSSQKKLWCLQISQKSNQILGTFLPYEAKVSFFIQCTKMQLITLQNFTIQTCFSQFLRFLSSPSAFDMLVCKTESLGKKSGEIVSGHGISNASWERLWNGPYC